MPAIAMTPTSVSAAPTIATLFFSDSVGTPQFIGKPKTRATLSCTILRASPSGMFGEVLCHLFARVRSHALDLRVVGTPHQVFDADHVAREHTGAVVLESGEELAMEVIAGVSGSLGSIQPR